MSTSTNEATAAVPIGSEVTQPEILQVDGVEEGFVESAWRRWQDSHELSGRTSRKLLKLILSDLDDARRVKRIKAIIQVMCNRQQLLTDPALLRHICEDLIAAGCADDAMQFLIEMAEKVDWNHKDLVRTCDDILEACMRYKTYSLAERLLSVVLTTPKTVNETYGPVFYSFVQSCASEDIDMAERLFLTLCKFGLRPTRRALDALLNGRRRLLTSRGNNTVMYPLEVVWTYFTSIRDSVAIRPPLDRQELESVYIRLMHECVRGKALVQAAEILSHMRENIKGSMTHGYNMLIGAYISAGNMDKAITAYRLMQSEQVEPNISTFNTVMNGYIETGNFDMANAMSTEVENKGLTKDVVYFNILIKLRAEENDFAGALNAVYRLREEGFRLHEAGVLSLISAYTRTRRFDDALRFLEYAETHGTRLSVKVYNMLLKALAKEGNTEGFERLARVMVARGIEPDDDTYLASLSDTNSNHAKEMSSLARRTSINQDSRSVGRAINTILTGHARSGETQQIWQYIRDLEWRGFQLKADTFNILLKSIAHSGTVQEAIKVFEVMRMKGVQPDTITYNSMITVCVKRGDLGTANRYFRQMSAPDKSSANSGIVIKPDKFTYTTLINAYAKRGSMDTASRLLSSMRMRGVQTDRAVYHALLQGYARMGATNAVKQTIEKMSSEGMRPTTMTYNVIVGAYIQRGNLEEAKRWMNEFTKTGLTPDIYTYNQLIQFHVANHDMDVAESVYASMSREGLRPDKATFNTLINGWCGIGDVKKAVHLLRRTEDLGVEPDHTTYTIVIGFYTKNRDWASAESIFKQWYDKASGTSPVAPEPFAAMIYGWGTIEKDLAKALSYWDKMDGAGVRPNTSAYTCLIQAHSFAPGGSLESILHIFDRLIDKRDGPEATVEAPTACVVLDACGHLNAIDALQDVWARLRKHELELKIAKWEWENVFNSYIEALIRCDACREAVHVLTQEMVTAKVEPTAKTFETCLTLLETRDASPELVDQVEKFMTRWPDITAQVEPKVLQFKNAHRAARKKSDGFVAQIKRRKAARGFGKGASKRKLSSPPLNR